MGIINITGIKLKAFHGCMPEENKVGGHYIVDVEIETDFNEAAKTDDLSKTIDYCEVYEIVKQEMSIPSKLIEHVAQRIKTKLSARFSATSKFLVKVTKLNPPINGVVDRVCVVC